MKAVGVPHLVWIIAVIFIIACFFSGAWLGRTLPTIHPVALPSRASSDERGDEQQLYRRQRETAIATAIASPAAVLILFVTGLVVSGIATRDAAASKQRTNPNPAQRRID
jgi:hypothetical protein